MKEAGFKIKIMQKPEMPDKLDKNLAYFLGLLITDGHIASDKKRGEHITMIFTSFEKERDVIISLIKRLFDYNAAIRKRKYGFNKFPNYEIHINSKRFSENLVKTFKIPAGAKSGIVRVPPFLFNSNKKEIGGFIRGVIDGDGSICKDHIKIASGSIKFLEDMKRLLNLIGISSGKLMKDKKSNTFSFYISSMENLNNLYHILYSDSEFCYPRKKQAFGKVFKL